MAQRKPSVGGNWKMNTDHAQAVDLARQVRDKTQADSEAVELVVYPPFPYLAHVAEVLSGSTIKLGGQTFSHKPNGAYTGEVSLNMLTDLGVSSVLVGHSERRHSIPNSESDALLNEKVLVALEEGFEVVLCVGETLEQRDANKTHGVNTAQVAHALAGVHAEQMPGVTIAYEPVWAIGTGKTATPDDAQGAHQRIRQTLGFLFDESTAGKTPIQYGGSVKPANAADLFAQADIDGGLIGGASLKPDDFAQIVHAAGGGGGDRG